MACVKHENTVWGWGAVSTVAWVGVPRKVWESSGKCRLILHCLESGHPEYVLKVMMVKAAQKTVIGDMLP